MALTQLTKVDGGGISTTSDYRVGIITASKFVGPFDGTGGNFSGVVTATNGVFSGNISAVDGNFSGNVSIGGTLTYEDVTNIDSVGIITARNGIDCNGDIDVDGHTNLDNVSVAGVSTFTGNADFSAGVDVTGTITATGEIRSQDDIRIQSNYPRFYLTDTDSNDDFSLINNNGSFLIYNDTQNAFRLKIDGTTGMCAMSLRPTADSTYDLGTNTLRWQNLFVDNVSVAGIVTVTNTSSGIGLKLVDASNKQFMAGGGGGGSPFVGSFTGHDFRIQVGGIQNAIFKYAAGATGNLELGPSSGIGITFNGSTGNAGYAGIITATKFVGNGDFVELDVDGHTNLDNVSVAGITTFSNGPVVVNGQYYRGIINSGSQEKIVGGYISGSDTLRLGESMYLTSTGLGIGVASPSRKLDVSGDILGNAFMLKGNTSASPSIQAQMYRPENNTLAFATNGNQERLRIKSDGKVLITNTLGLGGATSNPGDLLHAQSPSGEGKIVIIGATTGTVAISGLNGTSRVLFGDSSTENAGNITYTHSSDTLSFRINGNTRWKFDSSGHFLPDTAGAVNIGSATAEIGDVYIADDKKVQIGSSQDLQIYHTTSGTSWIRHTNSSEYFILEGNQMDFRDYATGVYRARMGTAVQLYYNGNNVKLATTNTGITVTGEVAASQDYPMVKPTLDCNFVLNKKLDPRIGYTRKGVASFYDEKGILKIVGGNVPRFDHDPETRESLGILIEEERTNLQPHSEQWTTDGGDGWVNIASAMDVDYDPGVVTPTGETTGAITFMETGASGQHYLGLDNFGATVSGTTYTFSFFFKNISGNDANNVKVITTTAAFPYMIRTFYFSGADAGTTNSPSDSTLTKLPNGWWRGTFTATANNNFGSAAWTIDLRGLNGGASYNNKIAIWGIQTETGAFPTSYIRTGNSDYGRTATRGVDFLQIQGQAFTDLYNPVESTILCSYQHTREVGSINASLGGSRRVYRFTTSNNTGSDTRIDFVSTSDFHPYIARDGSSPASLTATAPTTTAVNTYATRVKQDDFATTKAGGSITNDTSGDWDPSNKIAEIQIGGTWNGASTNALQAHYKRFTYYPVGLPNSQLITISS